jgi:CxxC motif-containing protein (DUF1111 family)
MNASRNLLIGLGMAALLGGCGSGSGGGGESDASAASGSGSSTSTTTTSSSGSGTTGSGATGSGTTGSGTTDDGAPAADPNPPALDQPPAVTSEPLPPATSTPIAQPPASMKLATGFNVSNPGIAVKPQVATASSSMGLNVPANAIDGNLTSRWESNWDDDEWIMFDFGAPTALGSMTVIWENAHASQYVIQISNDGDTWYQLRYISGSQGGTEQFMNLDSNARYVRILGIQRSGIYGYSIYEVQFESPGSDNTATASVTPSALAFPANGVQLAPPPATTPPLETVQFTLPDGTLVTRWGTVGRSRHGRERGEQWNEIGYGPNDTVDANGNPQDLGPGDYLTFVENYFKPARNWGIELIDNSHVAGVTRPALIMNQYFAVANKAGGEEFFRGSDRVGVTGYGWDTAGTLVNPQLYTNDMVASSTSCPATPYPPDGQLASASGLNGPCTVSVNQYPQHSALSPDTNGVLAPNGTTIPARSLQVGDVIEVTTSFFSSTAAMAVLNDPGKIRYYTNEWTYVMGTGLVPQMGVQPRLNNAPLPASTLQGGLGTVSYDNADNPEFNFQQPFNNIGQQNMYRFTNGRRWFHTNMDDGTHTEPGNDVNTEAIGLLGPHFNQRTCFGCHINNARSLAPQAINQRVDTMAVLTAALDANGKQIPDPTYGIAVQMNSQPSTTGATVDWGVSVRIGNFETKSVTLGDGTTAQLSKPDLVFDGAVPSMYSLRNAPQVIGAGLIAAIADADIIANARSAPNADGVKGVVNYSYDPATGGVCVGRFGWKASKCTIQAQVAGALLQDMSVTSAVYPSRNCMFGPANCNTSPAQTGIPADGFQHLISYIESLGVPAQRSQVEGFPKGVTPLPYLNPNPTAITAGTTLFTSLGCAACHVTQFKTSTNSELAEARSQTIAPYSDFLLHDMGTGLADGFPEGQATGSMFRTAPLWGIGMTPWVAGAERTGNTVQMGYLHDGRARSLTEAILWHGGEAMAAEQRFQQLSATDRANLLAFLNSL